jgi:hypothetical protein
MKKGSPAFIVLAILIMISLSWPISVPAESAIDPARAREVRWSTENLGPVVNSPYHDAFPTISHDGLVLYFASDRADYTDEDKEVRPWRAAKFDIYVSRRPSLTAPWGTPRRLPSHINTSSIEHSVSLSPDEHWLYFSSNRPGGCGRLDIYRAYREDLTDDLAWGEPENLGCDVNSPETDVCAIYHVDEESNTPSLFFVSNQAGAIGSLDVFESRLNPATNQFEYPEVVESLSSTAFDGHFDPEAGFLWTQREGGFGGSDIWVTRQLSSGEWEAPVNLGPTINTEFEEQMPSPFDHGKILYFPSDRPAGYGGLDIYVGRQL